MCIRDRSKISQSAFTAIVLQVTVHHKTDTGIESVSYTHLDVYKRQIIDRFLERGGNMMIMGDVGRQEVMNPLLRKVGLKLLPGIIAQPLSLIHICSTST